MEWKTTPQIGTRVTLGIIVWLALFDILLIWIAVQLPITLLTFFMALAIVATVPLFALLGYWLLGLRHSGYMLDRNMLVITWGPTQQVIPLKSIERIVPGQEVTGRARFIGAYWPGLWIGHGKIEGLGLTLFYATTIARDELLFVITPGLAYAISPADRSGFLQAFQQRQAMGPTQEVKQTSRRPAWFDWPLWSDKVGWGLVGLALVGEVILFGYLMWRFQLLPPALPLHFGLAGQPDRIADRAQIFSLPLISLLAWLANTLLGGFLYQRQDKFGAYLLWAGALLVQALVWIAVLGIIG